jgi:hypothetical protein
MRLRVEIVVGDIKVAWSEFEAYDAASFAMALAAALTQTVAPPPRRLNAPAQAPTRVRVEGGNLSVLVGEQWIYARDTRGHHVRVGVGRGGGRTPAALWRHAVHTAHIWATNTEPLVRVALDALLEEANRAAEEERAA